MIEQFEMVAKAIADASRLRIIKMLEGGELCVCRITMVLDLAPATVSKHLSILRSSGLLLSKKRGRWVYYRLADKTINPYAERMLAMVLESLEHDEVALKDRGILKLLSDVAPERLCDEGHEILREADLHEIATRVRYKDEEPARS